MQVNINKLSPVLVEFDIEVEADRVRSEFDKAFNRVAKGAKVKGFRPGKAPRRVLLHMFGARIAADVAQHLVDETFPQAVSGQNVQAVSAPAVERQKLELGQAFNYKARVEVLPEVERVDFEGLLAKRPAATATEEQIQDQLGKLQRSLSTLEPITKPRAAKAGDVVTLDFSVTADDKPIPEAGATDFQAELGDGTLLPAIEEALVGKKVGDSAEASVEMPPNHPAPALQGRTALFSLNLKEIKQRILPDLDDEFAKDAGEYATLDELKAALKEKIEKQLKEAAENAVAEQLVVELVKKNPIPIPGSLVEQQMKLTEQEILSQARARGQNNAQGIGEELRARIRADSEVKVRAGLLMAAIAKAEGIQIGDEQIEEGLKELAEQTGKNVAKVRAEYRGKQKREMLVGMILENKVLDIIEAKANIEDA